MDLHDITQLRQLRDIPQEVIVDVIMPFLPHDDWVNAIRALRTLFDNESRSVLREQYPSIVDSEINELIKEAYRRPKGDGKIYVEIYINWWKGIEKKFESLSNFPLACKEESEDSRLVYEPYSPIASRKIEKKISIKGRVNTFELTRGQNYVFGVERNILNGIFVFKEENPIVTFQITTIDISNEDDGFTLAKDDTHHEIAVYCTYKKDREIPTQVIRIEK
jgi:hypothetical protein